MRIPYFLARACTLTLSAVAVAEPREPADLIVHGEYVLTMEEGVAPLRNAAVVIRGERVVDVLPSAEALTRYDAVRVIPGKNRVVMPGLINGHTHSAMTLFRGMVDDLDLMTWLNDYVFPMERRFVTPEFVRIGSELACWEMIRGGTTTFVDMYFYPEEIASVVDRCGLRAVIGAPHIDYPSPGFEGWGDSFAAAREFVDKWQGRHDRIRPAFAPHAPYTVSADHLAATVDAAADTDALVSMHLSEGPAEVAQIQSTYGKTPVDHVADLGLFDQKLIAAHMVVLTEQDIQRVASAGVIDTCDADLVVFAPTGVAEERWPPVLPLRLGPTAQLPITTLTCGKRFASQRCCTKAKQETQPPYPRGQRLHSRRESVPVPFAGTMKLAR